MNSTQLQQTRIIAENELHLLFRQQHEFRRHSYPEWATYDGDNRFNDRLTDLSHESSAQRSAKNKEFLQQLQHIDTTVLSREDQIHAQLFAQSLQDEIQHHELGLHLMAIDQQEGMHLRFPQLVEIQPLKSYEQYEQYFSRLQSFAKQVDDTIENLKLGIQRDLLLSQGLVKLSLQQMQELASTPLEETPFYQPILQHAAELPGDLGLKVQEMAAQLIQKAVQPAYQRLYEFVANEYLTQAKQTEGLQALTQGTEIYQYWVDRHTIPGLDPIQIHQQGRDEVERLISSLRPLQSQLGLPENLRDSQLALAAQAPYQNADSMMSDYQQMLKQAQALLPELVSVLPQTDCILKEIESWRAAAAPQAYYYPPPQDLSRPGIFYVNTYDLAARPRYSMMALTLHEAVPGHHLQLARALELKNVPEFRYHLECNAFVEGWALYAEALGHPMGLYQDPLQAIGALSFELWRACRLVVDTGLHALGWTRQQAVDYFREHTLQAEVDIQSEIDRYLSLPAQALSYKIGELKIWELRALAEGRLNSKFDLKDFHEVLLQQGSIPLAVLEQAVLNWIENKLVASKHP